MKKLTTLILALVCALGLVGCSENKADKDVQIFKTENITCITFYTLPDTSDGFEVPSQYMDEITAWLSSFTVGEKAGTELEPGSDSISVKIEYSDGTVVENGLSTAEIDGATYYMTHDDAPECYEKILEQNG